MFEKEAERCADEYRDSNDYSSAEPYDIGYANGISIGFEKGAEFGYNKGRNEAKEILKGLYFIIESRIDYKNNIGIADEMWRAKQFWSVEK